MAQFRAKTLDIGCYVNKLVIRDHTKRKVFAEYETDRYIMPSCVSMIMYTDSMTIDKLFDMSPVTHRCQQECAHKLNSTLRKCTHIHD